jgi:ribosomal protein L29
MGRYMRNNTKEIRDVLKEELYIKFREELLNLFNWRMSIELNKMIQGDFSKQLYNNLYWELSKDIKFQMKQKYISYEEYN